MPFNQAGIQWSTFSGPDGSQAANSSSNPSKDIGVTRLDAGHQARTPWRAADTAPRHPSGYRPNATGDDPGRPSVNGSSYAPNKEAKVLHPREPILARSGTGKMRSSSANGVKEGRSASAAEDPLGLRPKKRLHDGTGRSGTIKKLRLDIGRQTSRMASGTDSPISNSPTSLPKGTACKERLRSPPIDLTASPTKTNHEEPIVISDDDEHESRLQTSNRVSSHKNKLKAQASRLSDGSMASGNGSSHSISQAKKGGTNPGVSEDVSADHSRNEAHFDRPKNRISVLNLCNENESGQVQKPKKKREPIPSSSGSPKAPQSPSNEARWHKEEAAERLKTKKLLESQFEQEFEDASLVEPTSASPRICIASTGPAAPHATRRGSNGASVDVVETAAGSQVNKQHELLKSFPSQSNSVGKSPDEPTHERQASNAVVSDPIKQRDPRQQDSVHEKDMKAGEDCFAGAKEKLTESVETPHATVVSRKSAAMQNVPSVAQISDFGVVADDGTTEIVNLSDVVREVSGSPIKSDAGMSSKASRVAAPISVFAALPLSKQVEHTLGRHLEMRRSENEYWTGMALKRARFAVEKREKLADAKAANTESSGMKPFSFASMKPIQQCLTEKARTGNRGQLARFEVEKMTTNTNRTRVQFLCPITSFDTGESMPPYAHSVGLNKNFLAPNVTVMHYWPYFGDDSPDSVAEDLSEQYSLDIDGRQQKLLRLSQAQHLEEYVGDAMIDLGIIWADILRFLLDPKPAVASNSDAKRALAHREESCKEEFSRRGERNVEVLASLPPSTPENLAKAGALCENFLRMAKFSLWHVVRRHLLDYMPTSDDSSEGTMDRLDRLTCAVCLQFDCPHHGEIEDVAEMGDESAQSTSGILNCDLINPPEVNKRWRVQFAPYDEIVPESVNGSFGPKRTLQYWQTFTHKLDDLEPFYPCHHPGRACDEAHCSCFENKRTCEKTCNCARNCPRKFQGCSCTHSHDKRRNNFPSGLTCFEDERCLCYMLGRECDPDLCGLCGVDEVLDPINRYTKLRQRCRNASIQRGVPKRTLIGDSGIHGLGLYAGETIHPHDFVGEYKGEVITLEEADRRGAVYQHQNLSYLFLLNATQEVDSTYFGNKMRFINHASSGTANLYPRVFLVNTVNRIALFAARVIESGEELLFDYGPKFPNEQLGGRTARKSASGPGANGKSAGAKAKGTAQRAKKDKDLLDEYYSVEIEEDELGNKRAKKATRGRLRKHDLLTVASGSNRSATPASASKAQNGETQSSAGRKPLSRKTAPAPKAQQPPSTPPNAPRPFAQPDGGSAEIDEGDFHRSAEARLAAYNIADDPEPEGLMEVDVDPGADVDENFIPESEGESEEDDGEGSIGDSQEEEDVDGRGMPRRRRRW